ITAKRFAFSPNSVTLNKGETVTLRLHSEDVTHGFFSRALKLDEVIEPGQTKDVIITPQTNGSFSTICDHFCGVNHRSMNMTIVVESWRWDQPRRWRARLWLCSWRQPWPAAVCDSPDGWRRHLCRV